MCKKVIFYIIPEIVSVRKYPVNIPGLQKLLRSHKKLTIKQIAESLDVAQTEAEHWFRTDKCFSIPRAEVWYELKKLLKIKTKKFDKSITTFENKESVFDMSNRVYDTDGIAPTLTSTTTDIRILL
jgi:DNA (cytosine-5)-methyltransferase 1